MQSKIIPFDSVKPLKPYQLVFLADDDDQDFFEFFVEERLGSPVYAKTFPRLIWLYQLWLAENDLAVKSRRFGLLALLIWHEFWPSLRIGIDVLPVDAAYRFAIHPDIVIPSLKRNTFLCSTLLLLSQYADELCPN